MDEYTLQRQLIFLWILTLCTHFSLKAQNMWKSLLLQSWGMHAYRIRRLSDMCWLSWSLRACDGSRGKLSSLGQTLWSVDRRQIQIHHGEDQMSKLWMLKWHSGFFFLGGDGVSKSLDPGSGPGSPRSLDAVSWMRDIESPISDFIFVGTIISSHIAVL